MSILSMGAGGAAEEYTLDQSLRFDDTAGSKLTRTPSVAGNLKTWTLSFWMKPAMLATASGQFVIFDGGGVSTTEFPLMIQDQCINVVYWSSATSSQLVNLKTNQVFRDQSAWYHIVWVYDSPQATAADRVKLYVNGSQVTSFSTANYPTQNLDASVNDAYEHYIGTGAQGQDWSGYLAEFYLIDGTALGASSFGETNITTGQWIPTDASTLTFGTNGFYLPFSSSQLSTDIKNLDEATGHSVRPFGNANTSTTYKQFGTASALFDGTGDYLACSGSHNSFIPPGSDFTIEFWLRWDGVVGSGAFILMDQRANTQNNGGWSVYSGGTYIGFDYSDGTTWAARLVATTALSTTAFQHYAIVHTGDTVILYVDGTQEDIETGVPMRNNNGTYNYLFMGGGYNNAGNHSNDHYCDCYLDEVRISNIARYTGASITVPTSAFTDDENTQLLMHMDGTNGGTTFTSSATKSGRHNITPAGDVKMTQAKTKVSSSSIYFDGTGDYFGVGPSISAPSSQDFVWGTSDWTVEMWVYNDVTQNTRSLMQCSTVADGGGIQLEWDGSNKISFYDYTLESNWNVYAHSASSTPIDAWYHMAIVRESQIFTMYIDGTAQTASGNTSSSAMGNPTSPQFGFHRSVAGRYMLDSYLDQIRISNTARYTSNFTAPTTAFTNDANTLFLVQPDWDSGFGADSSGNGNNFAPTNLTVSDQVIDTPTNNWCTWNGANKSSSVVLTKGNLQASHTSNATIGTEATIAFPPTGKWYYEMLITGGAPYGGGVGAIDVGIVRDSGAARTGAYAYGEDGNIYANGTTYAVAATLAIGDISSLVVDSDASKIYFYKNGVAQGAAGGYTIGAGQVLAAWGVWYNVTTIANFGQDPTFAGNFGVPSPTNTDANEKGSFALPVPTGALALCTDNLSDPSISGVEAPKNFNTVLYTGDGSPRTVTGVGFDSDLIWIKNTSAVANHVVQDRVRGGGYRLSPNTDDLEGTDPNGMTAFATDGFTIGGTGGDASYNTGSAGYVFWNWKANGAGSANTDGALNSTVSVNATAGFSIVSYTGDGTNNTTVGHGLSQAPELWVTKNRTTAGGNWDTFTTLIDGSVDFLRLNENAAKGDSGRTAPTASVFYVGNGTSQGANGDDYIAYCWHSVEGYSKIGPYVGNNNADGAFIYTGFRPAYVIIKRTNATEQWAIYDNKISPYNEARARLAVNSSAAEDTSEDGIDMVSNGFKCRTTWAGINASNNYLYIAFAESPFKTSNAR